MMWVPPAVMKRVTNYLGAVVGVGNAICFHYNNIIIMTIIIVNSSFILIIISTEIRM